VFSVKKTYEFDPFLKFTPISVFFSGITWSFSNNWIGYCNIKERIAGAPSIGE
jgi:site-specific recombinase